MDDAGKMTREVKIAILKDIIDGEIIHPQVRKDVGIWAIKALEQEPSEDAIRRQAVKELIKCGESTDTYDDVEQVCKWIDALPSVTQKSGKWIVHEKPHGIRYLECPYCNIWYLNEHLIRNSYCPNCGAKMVEPQESEE